MAEIVLITGLSGAGRSGAADVLEDLGCYVIDNLPTRCSPTIVDLAVATGRDRATRRWSPDASTTRCCLTSLHMRAMGHRVTVVFLDASTPVLVQRYDVTRRQAPAERRRRRPARGDRARAGLLQPVKAQPIWSIDTTELNVHQLKERLVAAFEHEGSAQLQVAVESFGYKHGLPLDADIVMDVRFLPNPHWDETLRPLTGHDPRVRDYVLERAVTAAFLDNFEQCCSTSCPPTRPRAELPDDRDRLHRRTAPLGGDRRGARPAVRGHGIAARTTHRDVGATTALTRQVGSPPRPS